MSKNDTIYPVLYSSRKEPLAIRARMALYQAGYTVELREINPDEPPEPILEHSEDSKIPLLIPTENNVINDSLEIMDWALQRKDPEYWLAMDKKQMNDLITSYDKEFEDLFEHSEGIAENSDDEAVIAAKHQILELLDEMEDRLSRQRYLFGAQITLADVAIFPHIREFKMLNSAYFDGLPYSRVHQWLTDMSFHRSFESVMTKFNIWKPGDPPILLAPWGQRISN